MDSAELQLRLARQEERIDELYDLLFTHYVVQFFAPHHCEVLFVFDTLLFRALVLP